MSEKVTSSSSDELQFQMDEDQANAEKSVSSMSLMKQNNSTDDIWRNINSNRDCFQKHALERTNALTFALETEEQVVPITDIHDSSKQLQSAADQESSEKEKSGVRGSFENKTILKPSPSVGTSLIHLLPEATNAKSNGSDSGCPSMMDEAWTRLKNSFVYFQSKPVGTLAAALDPSAEELNYNQVFVRDFVPTALAYLMKVPSHEPEIVKNFLLKTLHLQGWKKTIDNFTLGEGVMPASFKVMYESFQKKEVLKADFGGSAIGRVAPVDSGFWWIILLRSYTKCTKDYTLAEQPEVQKGMKLILDLCLSDGFDTFPTLLCADGCSMIDRRMGVYGYPIEIQALFFFALRCAQQMLKEDTDSSKLIERIERRITALSYHIRNYYWLDFTQLNNIYRYKTEEYSHTAVNKFNVIPESIPDWVFDFMPLRGGYFIGNVSPARMDFRWFLVGNCIAILSSLATMAQTTAIMDLVEERWEDLIGEMPLKIAYPALEGYEWNIVTGCDPKNTRWSYHNGGSWPVLLWLLTAACIKAGRPQIAKRAIELVEQRLSKDAWPEYYDGKKGRYIGKQARKYQTWSISGYLVAKLMIENPSNLAMISLEEDKKIEKPRLTRSASWPCSR
ncbi:putative beta-fructofuranosidase [Helianthus annuus]|nr:probable alkaline/neutral invertase F [Helianthus annuus]KAJ0427542.1 putative beta-fructofuranosidase [Helianthus annuus]KAJ0445822.1 putative beta-fructofuranosidase [Helianthus annuus]KAJ0666044.1 putative beta-fructofuranosidase [Helianthus annuus]KAJ0824295.1 putative beta-fructofuranosidase [Helianthus annuus]